MVGPVTLLVLDGWGVTSEKKGNAILNALTPNYNHMLKSFPNSILQASGEAVGLPPGLMGNSEVGHLNIGAGRLVIQKLTQISQTIIDGTFYKNPTFLVASQHVKDTGGALHLIGLLSDGCVHSSLDHLDALIEFAKRENIKEVFIHPILDGRDTPPKSARRFVKDLQSKLPSFVKIGTVSGRYYAMDRDSRWERTEKYWRALVLNEGLRANSALEAVDLAYERGETDEFVLPTVVNARAVKDGDSIICFNFRPDRMRQISRVLTALNFDGFVREKIPQVYFACLTEYDSALDLPVAFSPEQLPSQDMQMTLPELLSCHHIGQLHAAETEKYAHVTYFFNGGKEKAIEGEERLMIPSLKVATYDLAPKMQTEKVCEAACAAISQNKYPFIIINFANPDMVGHTGILEAGIEAVQSVDDAFGKLLTATKENKGTLFITADHGNIEQMIDLKTGEPHTAHTTNPVPFILADFSKRVDNHCKLQNGSLADVAPTILEVLNIAKPNVMTGKSLIVH
jgi:2,3-bisphosphoglycerate-independent phosphoglycerate mutase